MYAWFACNQKTNGELSKTQIQIKIQIQDIL